MPQKQIETPDSVVRLERVFLPLDIGNSCECYAWHPLDWPLQGCLIVEKQNGVETWSYAFAILPKDVPHSEPFKDPTYSAALGLIKSAFKKVVQPPLTNLVHSLWGTPWDENPFRHQNCADLAGDIHAMLQDPATKKLGAPELMEKVDELCSAYYFGQKRWSPVILKWGEVPPKAEANWPIAQAWKNYDLSQYTLDECAKKLAALGANRHGTGKHGKNNLGHQIFRLGLHAKPHIDREKRALQRRQQTKTPPLF